MIPDNKEGTMENWTDYTDALTADDADALAAVAEADIPEADDEEGDLPEYTEADALWDQR